MTSLPHSTKIYSTYNSPHIPRRSPHEKLTTHNQHPAPPIEVTVEHGQVTTFSINQTAVTTYLHQEIIELLQAAGIDIANLIIPIPNDHANAPLSKLRFQLMPGIYNVIQLGNQLIIPEEAYNYYVED